MLVLSKDQINRYADEIMTMIDEDIANGCIPLNVRCFGELHSYVDANEYTLQAQVPWGREFETPDDPCGLAASIDVEAEITRRLVTRAAFCTFGDCLYPHHDHTTTLGPDGEDLATAIGLRCEECGQPAHYCRKLRIYRHDRPEAPDCPSIRDPQLTRLRTRTPQGRPILYAADDRGYVITDTGPMYVTQCCGAPVTYSTPSIRTTRNCAAKAAGNLRTRPWARSPTCLNTTVRPHSPPAPVPHPPRRQTTRPRCQPATASRIRSAPRRPPAATARPGAGLLPSGAAPRARAAARHERTS